MAIHTDDLDIDDGNDRIVSPGAGNAEAVIERAYYFVHPLDVSDLRESEQCKSTAAW